MCKYLTCLQRIHRSRQQVHEKLPNFISFCENANQIHSAVPSHMDWDGYLKNKQVLARIDQDWSPYT